MFKKFSRNKQKNGGEEDEDLKKLFIFGYSCRLYAPNDETVEQADQQLIPWNGDEELKIDRYDCRLYLNNLDAFENTTKAVDPELSTEEKLEEEMCEEERYVEMYDAIRKVEESERLKRGKGAEFGFSYDTPDANSSIALATAESSSSEEEIEEPYVIPVGLKLPVGIDLPETIKHSAIIEKTASFVVEKGPQMEIVIKAKQRNDLSQFQFLEFDNRLNPFYKYICKLIREKKYTPNPPQTKTRPKAKKLRRLAMAEAAERRAKEDQEAKSLNSSHALKMIALNHGSGSEDSDEDSGYLHPLLRAAAANRSADDSNDGCASPMGPMPKPKPVEEPPPDFNEILSQLQRQVENTDNIYSSLFKNLNSIMPATHSNGTEDVEQKSVEESAPEIVHETDETKVREYNEWHEAFYGQPSPYLPKGPPIPLPPPPNLSSALGIAARYVAMNGGVAEQKLIDHNGDACAFLFSSSPYYTYYQARVRQAQWTLNQAYVTSLSTQNQASETTTATMTPATSIYVAPPRPPSALSAEQAVLVPTEMSVFDSPKDDMHGSSNNDTQADVMDPESALKQERKERARLFMEKILNDKLAAKKRQREIENSGDQAGGCTTTVQPTTSVALPPPPKISSGRISELINEKIQNVITSSPLLASAAKTKDSSPSTSSTVKKSKSSREDDRDDRSKKHDSHKSHRRKRSRSRDSAEDEGRTGKRSRSHKSPKKHTSRRRSRSSSRLRRR